MVMVIARFRRINHSRRILLTWVADDGKEIVKGMSVVEGKEAEDENAAEEGGRGQDRIAMADGGEGSRKGRRSLG